MKKPNYPHPPFLRRKLLKSIPLLGGGSAIWSKPALARVARWDKKEGEKLAVPRANLRDALPAHCGVFRTCLLYTSPSPRDATLSRMPSSA